MRDNIDDSWQRLPLEAFHAVSQTVLRQIIPARAARIAAPHVRRFVRGITTRLVRLAGGLMALLFANQVLAQSIDEFAVPTLGRIVVTAGTEKVAIDTPQAVTTLDQEDIDAKQATTMADVIEDVPGVSVVGGVSALGQSFNIRGIGSALAGDESKIIVQVDGVNKFHEQYRVGSFFSEPELYKRADVLRGPASSTLYGTGALAGVLTFTTKDARDLLGEA